MSTAYELPSKKGNYHAGKIWGLGLHPLNGDTPVIQAQIDFKGQSQDFKESSGGILFVFALGLVVVFLVPAAQFESCIHPRVIMPTVPLAMASALPGLWLEGHRLNIYSQIGLIAGAQRAVWGRFQAGVSRFALPA